MFRLRMLPTLETVPGDRHAPFHLFRGLGVYSSHLYQQRFEVAFQIFNFSASFIRASRKSG